MPGTSFVGSTSNQDINGLLTGVRWTPNSLSFSFPASASYYSSGYGDGEPSSGFAQLNPTQQAVVRTIFQNYSAVANLTFTEITETASVPADLRFARSTVPSTAWGYYPSSAEEGGDTWYRNSSSYNNPVMGNYSYLTFVHEIGHALGLKHGHETDTYGAMTFGHDSMEYSVMTYRGYVGASTSGGYTNENWGFAQSLMMYDIAALQTMYGANYNTNSGNTTYSWSQSTGELFVNGVGQGASGGNRIFMTIWDGGGFDVYDYSNYTTSVTVNLAPGSWTTTSAAQLAHLDYFDTNTHVAAGNIANALLFNNNTQSLIEAAYGGAGNDNVVGNQADNVLIGNAGNDIIDGVGGNDTLDGGAGNDTIWGGAGDDTFVLSSGADAIRDFVAGAGGVDEIDLRAASGVMSLADVLARATQSGAHTVIDFGGGNTLTLDNINKNNLVSSDFLFSAPPSQTDLTASSVVLNGTSISFTINNVGVATAAASAAGIYLSTDSTITSADMLVTSVSTPSLTAGGSVTQGTTLTIPGNLAVGTYYLGVLADYNGQVAESSDANNASNTVAVILGNDSANTFAGTSAADMFIGLAGGDALIGLAGTNTMTGGAGDDVYYSSSATDIIVELAGAAEGNDVVVSDHSIVLSANMERVILLNGATSATGNGSDNLIFGLEVTNAGLTLDGGAGNDILYGSEQSDTLLGGSGVDTLLGFGGTNNMTGGAGDDTYFSYSATDTINENAGAGEGVDQVISTHDITLSANVENLTLRGLAATGIGNGGDNQLFGLESSNGLILQGLAGADVLIGSNQADLLEGGTGNDFLFGASGADAFQFKSPGFGNDTVTDFVTTVADGVNHDYVDLRGLGQSFGSLNIAYGTGATITIGADTIFLTGVTSGLQSSDFLF